MKKNKNSLKNLKQFKKFRTRAKFQFYVVFRPRAQKLFFPIVFLIFSIACANHWYDNRGVWNFENATIQVGNKAQDQTHERSEEAQMEDGTNRGKNSVSVAEVVGGTQVSSVNGSAIEKKIRAVFHKEPEKAVKVFTCESHLNPTSHSEVDIMEDGRAFSVGVAQINLTVTNVGGLNCPAAFNGQNKRANVIDEKLYASCVRAAEDLDTNLAAAIPKYEGRGDFSAWQWCNNKTNEVATL